MLFTGMHLTFQMNMNWNHIVRFKATLTQVACLLTHICFTYRLVSSLKLQLHHIYFSYIKFTTVYLRCSIHNIISSTTNNLNLFYFLKEVLSRSISHEYTFRQPSMYRYDVYTRVSLLLCETCIKKSILIIFLSVWLMIQHLACLRI